MQNTLSLVKDVRGCMTRFDPLTPEIVAAQAEDGLTYDELKEVLEQCGMDIEKVDFDGSRAFQNAYYADFEQDHYCWIPFQKKGLKEAISKSKMQKFLQPRCPRYDGEKFIEDPYIIREEELICWRYASLRFPLNSIGVARFQEVFKHVFPHGTGNVMQEREADHK